MSEVPPPTPASGARPVDYTSGAPEQKTSQEKPADQKPADSRPQSPGPAPRSPAVSLSATLARLPAGSEIAGSLLAAEPGARPVIRTEAGSFTIHPADALPKADQVALRIVAAGATLRAEVFAADGKPLPIPLEVELTLIRLPSQAGPPAGKAGAQTAAPPQLLANASLLAVGSQVSGTLVLGAPLHQGDARPAGLAAPGNAPVPVGTTFTFRLAGITPPPGLAGVSALPAGVAGATAPEVPGATAGAPVGATLAAPATSPGPTGPAPAGPGLATGTGALPTAAQVAGAAPATFGGPAPQSAGQGVPESAAAPATPGPAGTPGGALSGAQVSNLPGAAVQAASGAGQGAAPARIIQGVVVADTPAASAASAASADITARAPSAAIPQPGAVSGPAPAQAAASGTPLMVRTADGLIRLDAPAQIAAASTLDLEVIEARPPGAPPPPVGGAATGAGAMLLFQSWPALQDALQVLRQVDLPVAREVAEQSLPSATPRLGSTLLFFMAVLNLGDLRGWLGGRAIEKLEQAGRGDLVRRLSADFERVGRLNRDQGDGRQAEWRPLVFPFLDGEVVRALTMFSRQHGQDEGEDPAGAGTRFVLEIELSRLGPMQFDGLVHDKRFDLIIRTAEALPEAMRATIKEIFTNALGPADLTGTMTFKAETQFPFSARHEYLQATGPARLEQLLA